MGTTLPSLFVGHGNPMNALTTNAFTDAWRAIGRRLRPRAILAISAHWYVRGTGVTVSTAPRTIHDFGGFPQELYQVQYPAPGDPALARRVQQLLAPLPVVLDESWGLDHGTWSVLTHVYPEANVPIVQLSIDATKPASFHYEIGRKLAQLREEGVLIFASGNLIHNLRTYAWGRPDEVYEWAQRFEHEARGLLLGGDHQPLVQYESLGRDAQLAIPSADHYLPLLYVLGSQQSSDAVRFPVEGIEGGSLSMISVEIGAP